MFLGSRTLSLLHLPARPTPTVPCPHSTIFVQSLAYDSPSETSAIPGHFGRFGFGFFPGKGQFGLMSPGGRTAARPCVERQNRTQYGIFAGHAGLADQHVFLVICDDALRSGRSGLGLTRLCGLHASYTPRTQIYPSTVWCGPLPDTWNIVTEICRVGCSAPLLLSTSVLPGHARRYIARIVHGRCVLYPISFCYRLGTFMSNTIPLNRIIHGSTGNGQHLKYPIRCSS